MYVCYKFANADTICNDSPTEVQPPPNLLVATSAQRAIHTHPDFRPISKGIDKNNPSHIDFRNKWPNMNFFVIGTGGIVYQWINGRYVPIRRVR